MTPRRALKEVETAALAYANGAERGRAEVVRLALDVLERVVTQHRLGAARSAPQPAPIPPPLTGLPPERAEHVPFCADIPPAQPIQVLLL